MNATTVNPDISGYTFNALKRLSVK